MNEADRVQKTSDLFCLCPFPLIHESLQKHYRRVKTGALSHAQNRTAFPLHSRKHREDVNDSLILREGKGSAHRMRGECLCRGTWIKEGNPNRIF